MLVVRPGGEFSASRLAAFLLYGIVAGQSSTISVIRKRRGRPATGVDPLVAVRIPASTTARVDDWGRAKGFSRSEAIRQLIELGFEAAKQRGGLP